MFQDKVRRCARSAAIAFLILGATIASAYQVSPMIYDLTPSGRGATAVLRVQNDSPRPITIEMTVEKRNFDEQGNESRTPAEDDFIIFPPQAVIAANTTQAIRVQYAGPQNLERSVMYVVTVKQIPVTLPANGPSGVQFVFNFGTVANVVPPGARANVEVVSLTPTATGYALRVRNIGNKYANLSLSRVTLTSGAQSVVLEGEGWRRALGTSWLLPGNERIINLPAQATLTSTPTARFQLIEPTNR